MKVWALIRNRALYGNDLEGIYANERDAIGARDEIQGAIDEGVRDRVGTDNRGWNKRDRMLVEKFRVIGRPRSC